MRDSIDGWSSLFNMQVGRAVTASAAHAIIQTHSKPAVPPGQCASSQTSGAFTRLGTCAHGTYATSPALNRARTGGGSGSPAVANGSLILWHSGPTARCASSPDIPALSKRTTCDSSVLRYVLVNDANLKTQAYCSTCGTKIGQRYVRKTGSRSMFCDFACYRCAVEEPVSHLGAGAPTNLFAASQCHGETK